MSEHDALCLLLRLSLILLRNYLPNSYRQLWLYLPVLIGLHAFEVHYHFCNIISAAYMSFLFNLKVAELCEFKIVMLHSRTHRGFYLMNLRLCKI